MKHYILFNDVGLISGRYIEGLNSEIPEGAMEVSEELFNQTASDQEGGDWKLIDGEIVKVPFPDPAPFIPQSVTPAQGLMALYVLKGISEDDILAAIASIEDPIMRYQALIAFKKATVWERVSETMGVVAQLLALSEADKDALFTLGATYTSL